MRVAVLVGSDSLFTRRSIESLCGIPEIQVVGVLLDAAHPSGRQRLKHLWRNSKREGAAYFFTRGLEMLLDRLEATASSVVSAAEVDALLRSAFPEEALSLNDLAARRGFELNEVWNLNSPEAARILAELHADLGVVLGTRILKRSTFNVPRLGSINVHKGKVPDFRGMPPGFWEIYEGQPTCGITIHFVNDGLDTGDIIREAEIPIHARERPETLLHKLDEASIPLLAEAVRDLSRGTAAVRAQPKSSGKARTRPTRKQIAALAARAPHLSTLRPRTAPQLAKTILYLLVYKSGLLALRRRLRTRSRAAILLYHRVDDYSNDPLTTTRRRFAEHLCLLRKHYEVRSTAWLMDALTSRAPIPPRTVILHFDDCYASVADAAGPLLKSAALPAMSFVSSGFIDSDRQFAHDAKYPLRYPNMTATQIKGLAGQGVAVGSHTVTHADLGTANPGDAEFELKQSKIDLESCLGGPVALFSYPYGRTENFRPEYAELARSCGYEAIFSAYGGFVRTESDLFDIPRFGVADSHRPIDLLMDLEGLGAGSLKDAWARRKTAD